MLSVLIELRKAHCVTYQFDDSSRDSRLSKWVRFMSVEQAEGSTNGWEVPPGEGLSIARIALGLHAQHQIVRGAAAMGGPSIPKGACMRWSRHSRRMLTAATLAGVLGVIAAAPAYANTRDNANSYMNQNTNVNSVPGAAYYFSLDRGTHVWMNCWTQGPLAMGQYKWFNITARDGVRQGLTGYVPAPSVSSQWTSSSLCPPW